MKICTITCHDVYNHGASLQAYALMRFLNKLGHEVEIINYKPLYLSNHYNLFNVNNPKWEKNFLTKAVYLVLKFPGRLMGLRRKRAFDKFTKEFLNVGPKKYISNDDLRYNLPDADIYICGSDQIWNSSFMNGRDPAFYLDFVPEDKLKIAYAPSFATDEVADEFKPMIKQKVERLNKVSVREKSGAELLRNLGIEDVSTVLDPVFLLSIEEWSLLDSISFKDKYILVYDFDRNLKIEHMVKEIAKRKGLKIYSVSAEKTRYADKNFQFVGPSAFISLIKNAEFVVSNSFHAVAFSIIFEKNFVVVNRKENINTRMRDLLQDLDLADRIFTKSCSIDDIMQDINYEHSKRILSDKISESIKYLSDF